MAGRGFQVVSFRFVLLIVVAGIRAMNGAAQASPDGARAPLHPTFDVVSIHPMKEDDGASTHITNPTRTSYFEAVNVNVKALMEVAYKIPDTRMFGGPGWLTAAKFSVEAKADPQVDAQMARLAPEQREQLKREMLTALLNDRFKLAVHTETRMMPVFALVLAKTGPRLGGIKAGSGTVAAGDDRIDIGAGNDTLEILAYELSWRLGRPVLDRTGLEDRDALVLRWQDDSETATDSSAASLATAIEEQLGLKLEPTRSLVPVLVIEHAEKPTEN